MSNGRTDERRVCVLGDLEPVSLPSGIDRVDDRAAADLIVAGGESALLELARDGCATPVLPVDAGTGVRSVREADLSDALESVRADEGRALELPVLGVDVDGEPRGRALFDVMLVTSEAAHISEFDLETPRDDIAEFRADGVVVATAAGTSGYARRLGVPVFAPEVDAAAVAPIAAFATSLDHWVIPPSEAGPLVEARVVREEAAVSLLLDDRDTGTVPPNTPVTVDVVDALSVRTVPESQSCFHTSGRSPRDGGLE